MTKLQLKKLINEVIAEASMNHVFVVYNMERDFTVHKIFSTKEKAIEYVTTELLVGPEYSTMSDDELLKHANDYISRWPVDEWSSGMN